MPHHRSRSQPLGPISRANAGKVTRAIAAMLLFAGVLLVPACTASQQADETDGTPEPALGVKFEASTTSGRVPLTVSFTNKSGGADEFQWDFGDGTSLTTSTVEEEVTHEYTTSGTHVVTLTAVKSGDTPQTGTATVSIELSPGSVATVAIKPSPLVLAAGESLQLQVAAADEFGNEVAGMGVAGNVTWSLKDEKTGSLTDTGMLTAREVAGNHTNVLEAQVRQGSSLQTAIASITIVPGPLDRIVVAPDPAEIGIGMTQQFVAVAVDRYGNRLSGASFAWSVDDEAGTIDGNGLFTASDSPGTYDSAVRVEATHDGATESSSAEVTVEPDRIAFISDREDDQYDIYIMTADGSNIERLTETPGREFMCNWSPDGRRLVYDSIAADGGIFVMNDDGGWTNRLLVHDEDGGYTYPAWSPDGTRIAFVRWVSEEDLDIFTMAIDGGEMEALTETPDATEWVPYWSPDGTRIVYDYTPKGQRGRIYVINADGSNRRELTNSMNNDTEPVWSPDGKRIAFQSNRDGDYEIYVMNTLGGNLRQLTSNHGIQDVAPHWSPDSDRIVFASDRDSDEYMGLYVMNTDGSNVKRLTDADANHVRPRWAPRKAGVEVAEASIVIPNTSKFEDATLQEVTAAARGAVVRIETDIAAGSGFIIDPEGLILTNSHVISGAEEITAYLGDGTSYECSVRASDLVRDIAVLEIEATGLPHLELGDLSLVDLGQQVLVLGYPLKAESVSVTGGYISAIEYDSGRNITWVQTDSAINPGNSGGPLLSLQGQVIGMVSSKIVGFGIEGVGFAISANTVNAYLPQLLASAD